MLESGRRRRQDGGVEGSELTPSYGNTKITINYWTTTDKKMLEPIKIDTLHPKTKKPQGDSRRGAIMIKSNPIHTRWATHKPENNYTTEVLPQEWKFWAPHLAPQPGGLATGGGSPRESGFECQQGLIIEIPQDGETETLLLEGTHRASSTLGPRGKKWWLHKRLGQTYLLVLEGLLRRWGAAVAHCSDKDAGGSSFGEYSLTWALLEATIFSPRPGPTQQPGGSSSGMPQAKQPTGWDTAPPISRQAA